MSTLRNLLVLTASGALLAACSGPDIAMLKGMPGKGTAFDRGLQAGYSRLAEDEARENDFVDSDHFGKRASMAANGLSGTKSECPEGVDDDLDLLAGQEYLSAFLRVSQRVQLRMTSTVVVPHIVRCQPMAVAGVVGRRACVRIAA